MKNILITGSNGFVARNIIKYMNGYNVTCVNRNHFNLTDAVQVNEFFKDKYFHAVIHTATSGGSRLKQDEYDVFVNNCFMHQNIMNNHMHYDKYISFGSGAELDRKYDICYNSNLENSFPIDPYGMSKNFIAKTGLTSNKFTNLRIYNVFNEDELDSRMIKFNLINYLMKKSIIIHQDRCMDFFYIEDLAEIINFILESKSLYKEFNCVYEKKYNLVDIAYIINKLDDHKVDIKVINQNKGLSYYGKFNLPKEVRLIGLESSIEKTYLSLKNNLSIK
jgi:nucleoside-diphosphate-sugar epimerase